MNKRIRKFFSRSDESLLLIPAGNGPDALYFTGANLEMGFLLISPEEQRLIVPRMGEALARESFSGEITVVERGRDSLPKLKELIRGREFGIDMKRASAHMLKRLRRAGKPVDVSSVISAIRSIKDEGEISRIKHACSAAKRICATLKFSGKTEMDVAKEIEKKCIDTGDGVSFSPLVAFGDNTRFPHAPVTGRKFHGGPVLVDMGVRWKGYCSDITRCSHLGEKLAEEYEKLKEISYETTDFITPGASVRSVAKHACALMKKAGFPKMVHSFGHGIGLEIHEDPRISPEGKGIFENGMVLTLEPAVYAKSYGLRFEEVILLKGKARVL